MAPDVTCSSDVITTSTSTTRKVVVVVGVGEEDVRGRGSLDGSGVEEAEAGGEKKRSELG